MHKYIQNILSKLNHNKFLDLFILATPETRKQALLLAHRFKSFRINPIIFLNQENSADFYEDDIIIKFRNFAKPASIIKDDFATNFPNIILSFDEPNLFSITKKLVSSASASLVLVDNNNQDILPKQKHYLTTISKFVIYEQINAGNFTKGYTWQKFMSDDTPITRDDFLQKINLFNEKQIKSLAQTNLLLIGQDNYLGSEFFNYLKKLNYKITSFNPQQVLAKNYKSVIKKGKYQVVLDFNGLSSFATKSDYELFLNTVDSCGLTHYLLLLPEDPTTEKLLKQTVIQNINPQVRLRSVPFKRVYGFLNSPDQANRLLDFETVSKIIKQEDYFLISDYLQFLFNEFSNLTLNTKTNYEMKSYQYVWLYVISKQYEILSKDSLMALFNTESSPIRKAVFSFLIATK